MTPKAQRVFSGGLFRTHRSALTKLALIMPGSMVRAARPLRPQTPAASPSRLSVPAGHGMTTDWDFCKNTQAAELFPGANPPQITVSPLSEFVLSDMASIQRLKSPLTGRISYRVQARVQGWRGDRVT